jgi:hypothetical protein
VDSVDPERDGRTDRDGLNGRLATNLGLRHRARRGRTALGLAQARRNSRNSRSAALIPTNQIVRIIRENTHGVADINIT